mmetsp:Transcript_9483/g.34503  ORF Transcript_9483/g.34503 Transcript_9483/m.34503 type:complete len:204 (-) Transcript_9483:960-1571(-)
MHDEHDRRRRRLARDDDHRQHGDDRAVVRVEARRAADAAARDGDGTRGVLPRRRRGQRVARAVEGDCLDVQVGQAGDVHGQVAGGDEAEFAQRADARGDAARVRDAGGRALASATRADERDGTQGDGAQGVHRGVQGFTRGEDPGDGDGDRPHEARAGEQRGRRAVARGEPRATTEGVLHARGLRRVEGDSREGAREAVRDRG